MKCPVRGSTLHKIVDGEYFCDNPDCSAVKKHREEGHHEVEFGRVS